MTSSASESTRDSDEVVHRAQSREKFSTLMKRMLNRQAIREASSQDTGGYLAKAATRRGAEKSHSELTEALLVERVLPDPEIEEVVSGVVEQLREEYHDNSIAIALLGSSGFGGRLVRKAFANVGPDIEIDYALITDNKISNKLAQEIQGRVDALLPISAEFHQKEKPELFRSCSLNNAFYLHLENLNDPVGLADEFINEIDSAYPLVKKGMISFEELVPDFIDQLTIYFSPSVPKETNEANARQALTMLSEIHSQRPEFWEEIVGVLKAKWEKQHKIKAKHILGTAPRTTKEEEMAKEIERVSGEAMSEEMIRLLEST